MDTPPPTRSNRSVAPASGLGSIRGHGAETRDLATTRWGSQVPAGGLSSAHSVGKSYEKHLGIAGNMKVWKSCQVSVDRLGFNVSWVTLGDFLPMKAASAEKILMHFVMSWSHGTRALRRLIWGSTSKTSPSGRASRSTKSSNPWGKRKCCKLCWKNQVLSWIMTFVSTTAGLNLEVPEAPALAIEPISNYYKKQN